MAEDMAAWHAATVGTSDDLQRAIGQHKAELARIRQGPLAGAQKRREVAASYLAAAGKVADLKRGDAAALDAARQRAEERAFEPPPGQRDITHIMAARDAADRIRKVTKPAAAPALLDQALLDKDHTLARAVARHAHAYAWHDVTGRWADTQPPAVRARALDDWAAANHLQSPAGRVARSMAYSLTQPPEVGGMSQEQIQQLTAEAAGKYGGGP